MRPVDATQSVEGGRSHAKRGNEGKRRGAALRRGFTLVELLVVITIILALATIAIGVSVPDVQTRRLREASRLINAFLLGAAARAAETGRPVAVIIVADASQSLMSRTLKYAEVPPPYAGDTLNESRAVINRHIGSQAEIQLTPDADGTITPNNKSIVDTAWRGQTPDLDLIRVGDLIQFNYQGHFYQIVQISDRNLNLFIIQASNTTNRVLQPKFVAMSYQIFRQPVASAAAELELPESVVVDLGQSGPGTFRFSPGSVTIVFSPGGTVPSYMNGGSVIPASRPFYLLVGKREQVETGANLDDFETIWIAVNNQTGLVTSVENAGNQGGGGFIESRAFARKAQSLGGR